MESTREQINKPLRRHNRPGSTDAAVFLLRRASKRGMIIQNERTQGKTKGCIETDMAMTGRVIRLSTKSNNTELGRADLSNLEHMPTFLCSSLIEHA
jgi:hypothetical protein